MEPLPRNRNRFLTPEWVRLVDLLRRLDQANEGRVMGDAYVSKAVVATRVATGDRHIPCGDINDSLANNKDILLLLLLLLV